MKQKSIYIDSVPIGISFTLSNILRMKMGNEPLKWLAEKCHKVVT
jgi:hypothetical protein